MSKRTPLAREELLAAINGLRKSLGLEPVQVGDSPTDIPTERAEVPKHTAEQKKILEALANVAGAQFQQSDIEFRGSKLVLPSRWTIDKSIRTLQEYKKAQEEYTEFHRTYNYRPWDGAAATERALRTLTGTAGIGKAIPGFFGDTPPQRITINVGVNNTISVPWGRLGVPLFQGVVDGADSYIELNGTRHRELGMLFSITAWVPKKYEAQVNGLFELIQKELEEGSIYKGQAITGAAEPEFLDLSGVDPEKVIYSDDVMAQLDAHLWGPIQYADQMHEHGISLKRSVLFFGPYGTGKTLGGMLTAQQAVKHGFTFLQCRPGKDDPFEVMQTAQLYSPAVVFIEDIDTYSRSQGMGHDKMSKLLDQFDGIAAKGHDILNVMTTNHQESITKGMLRPGRLDALIEIAHLDRGGVERMVKSKVTPEMLDDVDYDKVFEACEGYLPAFVAEAVDRAKLASISRGNGDLLPLSTADLKNGAMSLRPQFELMTRASEVDAPPMLDTVMKNIVSDEVGKFNILYQDSEDVAYDFEQADG